MASPASTSPSIGQAQNPRKTRSPAPPAVTAALSRASGSSHSVHMQQVGQISHDQFPQDICISWSAAGENVGEAAGSENQGIQNLHQQMMNEGPSGGHYQNIMSGQFAIIGIGLYYVNGVLWLTEDFVRP